MNNDFSKIVHPAGTIILCEAGYEVCEIGSDLHRGQVNYSSLLINWRKHQVPAVKGDVLPLKCWCGAVYFATQCGIFEHTKPPLILNAKDLIAKMREFISTSDPHNKDDWYMTSQGMAEHVLTDFAEFLGIKLEETSSATPTKENLP